MGAAWTRKRRKKPRSAGKNNKKASTTGTNTKKIIINIALTHLKKIPILVIMDVSHQNCLCYYNYSAYI